MIPEIKQCEVVEKKWGCEKIIFNSEKYCGKVLSFNKGAKFSLHFHLLKQETWLCVKGAFMLNLIDTETAKGWEFSFNIGDTITISPGMPHQLISLEDSEIFEVSTEHFDNDSYRILPGDSQK